MTLSDRARGSLVGLAVGDALGTPTEGKSHAEIVSRWGRVLDFLSDDQGGSDDTEYAIFNARLVLEKKHNLTSEDVAAAWRREIINSANSFQGAGFSEILAIGNLLKGLQPPASGQHLHSWSDGLAMRVAPFGIVSAGDSQFAAHLAYLDGTVSHSGEGVFCGQAVAAAVATAMAGDSLDRILEAAMGVIPNDSWTASSIARGIRIGNSSKDVWDALQPLLASIACPFYYWTDVGPEAIGLAFGIIAAARGQFENAVIGAVNIGRDSDTIAAIAGSICGASGGFRAIPERWPQRVSSVRGACINSVKDMNVIALADELAQLAQSWRK